MKIERILRLTVLFIIAVLVVASCDDDGYSLSKFSISYGVIHKSAEDSYTVKLITVLLYIRPTPMFRPKTYRTARVYWLISLFFRMRYPAANLIIM